MANEQPCMCSSGPTLIFACSGAADVGAISDQAARKLTTDQRGKMFCLAGIGARVPGILKTTESAARILAIDGCTLNCVKGTLEQAGFKKFLHLQMADLGMEKGKTPPSSQSVSKVVDRASEMLVCK